MSFCGVALYFLIETWERERERERALQKKNIFFSSS
jgi:hypothetical protein